MARHIFDNKSNVNPVASAVVVFPVVVVIIVVIVNKKHTKTIPLTSTIMPVSNEMRFADTVMIDTVSVTVTQ